MEDLFELFYELGKRGRGEGEYKSKRDVQGDVDQNYQNSH
jgi:hypothetical protein